MEHRRTATFDNNKFLKNQSFYLIILERKTFILLFINISDDSYSLQLMGNGVVLVDIVFRH